MLLISINIDYSYVILTQDVLNVRYSVGMRIGNS